MIVSTRILNHSISLNKMKSQMGMTSIWKLVDNNSNFSSPPERHSLRKQKFCLVFCVLAGWKSRWCPTETKKKKRKAKPAETRRRQSFCYFCSLNRKTSTLYTKKKRIKLYIVTSFVQGNKHWLWYCIEWCGSIYLFIVQYLESGIYGVHYFTYI